MKKTPIKLMMIFLLLQFYNCARIWMSVTPQNLQTGSVTKYSIEVNRQNSDTSQVITPSQVSESYTITIIFNNAFNLKNSVTTYSNTVINQNTNSITVQLQKNVTLLMMQVDNVGNPFASETDFVVSCSVRNQTGDAGIVDESDISIKFTRGNFGVNNITWSLSPGNVSTKSTLDIKIITLLWKSGMKLQFKFAKQWINSLSFDKIFSTESSCSPQCNMTLFSNQFYIVEFLNFINITNLQVTFINILSPPALSPIYPITITSIIETNKVVQQTEILIASLYPNNLKTIEVVNFTSLPTNVMQLSLNLQSANFFGYDDSILVKLNTIITSISVQLKSQTFNSFSLQVISSSSFKLYDFKNLTSSYSQLQAILQVNGVSQQRSMKPVVNNTITINRNLFPYNQGHFIFSTVEANITQIQSNLDNLQSNINASLSLKISLSKNVIVSDEMQIKFPDSIQIHSCNGLDCADCSCNIQNKVNDGFIYIRVENFTTQITSVSLKVQVTNPVPSSYVITICTMDDNNYTIQCGQTEYPSLTQTRISSDSISFTTTNNIIYGIGDYTIQIDLTSQNLVNGYLFVRYHQLLTVVGSVLCTVNGEVECSVNNTGNLIISVPVRTKTKVYSIVVKNIRNPKSTQPFNFSVEIFSNEDRPYYSLVSKYYSIQQPYPLLTQVSQTSLINSQPNNLSISFIKIPFEVTNSIVVDSNHAQNSSDIRLKKINLKLNFINPLQISINNHYSSEPIRYSFRVKSSDQLYEIFSFQVILTSSQPSNLAILNQNFAGLLQDENCSLNIQFSSPKTISKVSVQFPVQYSSNIGIKSNALVTLNLAPRIFELQISYRIPISITLWNFITISPSTDFFKISTYAFGTTSSTINQSYLVSQNKNTINYNLSQLSDCTFPCKLCEPINNAVCLLCYSSRITQQYLLEDNKCTSRCSIGKYQNTSGSQCLNCPSECQQCTTSIICTKCDSTHFLHNSSCKTECPSFFYPINIEQTCKSCPFPCAQCVSNVSCESCSSGYTLHQNSSCVIECDNNYISISKICQKCMNPCFGCSGSLTNCTRCVSGYNLHSHNCLNVCPQNLVPNNSICTNCSSNCKSCINSPSKCISCYTNFNLHNNSTCLTHCPSSFYSLNETCVGCKTQCKLCIGLNTCSFCQSGYTLYNEQCLTVCPSNYYIAKVNIDSIETKVCQQCSTGCQNCVNNSVCLGCKGDFFLYFQKCINNCPQSTYATSHKCESCSSSCLKCSNVNICSQCSSSTSLYNDSCVTECPPKTISQPHNNSGLFCSQCLDIHTFCQNCTLKECTLCITGYLLMPNNTCVGTCPKSFTKDSSNRCLSCFQGCTDCFLQTTNCSQCATNYIHQSNGNFSFSCTLICNSPKIAYQGLCTECHISCQFCSVIPSNCTSCWENSSVPYFVNSSCLSDCPPQYYSNNLLCEQCPIFCSHCDQYGCKQCLPNSFRNLPQTNAVTNLSYYNCYSNCPSHLSFIDQNTCLQCALHCLTCNSEQCFQCQDNWLIYGIYCVVECPLSLNKVGIRCSQEQLIDTNTEKSTVIMPLPFTISSSVLVGSIILSRLYYIHTSVILSAHALFCILTVIANVYYLIFLRNQLIIIVSLLLAVIINYILNVIYIFIAYGTINRDFNYAHWRKQIGFFWYLLSSIIICTSHTAYSLMFSCIFNLSIFKAQVSDIRYFTILNYLWGIQLFVHLLAGIAGVTTLEIMNSEQIDKLLKIYSGADLIIMNLIMLVLSVLLLRKDKTIWRAQHQNSDETSTNKKVIFDQDSNANVNFDGESMYEKNGHIIARGFKVANSDICEQLPTSKLDENLYFEQNYSKQNNQQQPKNLSNLRQVESDQLPSDNLSIMIEPLNNQQLQQVNELNSSESIHPLKSDQFKINLQQQTKRRDLDKTQDKFDVDKQLSLTAKNHDEKLNQKSFKPILNEIKEILEENQDNIKVQPSIQVDSQQKKQQSNLKKETKNKTYEISSEKKQSKNLVNEILRKSDVIQDQVQQNEKKSQQILNGMEQNQKVQLKILDKIQEKHKIKKSKKKIYNDNKRYVQEKNKRKIEQEKSVCISGINTLFVEDEEQQIHEIQQYAPQNFSKVNHQRISDKRQKTPEKPGKLLTNQENRKKIAPIKSNNTIFIQKDQEEKKQRKNFHSSNKSSRFKKQWEIQPNNVISIASQIQRKQRLKKQQSSLKNIYLGKL